MGTKAKVDLNFYLIYLGAETCCDYWSMEVAVVAETYEEAKEIATQKFNDRFHEPPSRSRIVEIYCAPIKELTTKGFSRIVSSDSGAK